MRKLSDEQVKELKAKLAEGMTQPRVAQLFGVSRSTVSDIATGRIYGGVPWPEGGPPLTKHPGRQRTWRSEMKKVLALLGFATVGVLLLCVLAVLVRGLCLSVLWGWLIVPVFGLPALGIAPAIGLTVFLNFLLDHKKEEHAAADIIVVPLFVLGVGWLIHLFI